MIKTQKRSLSLAIVLLVVTIIAISACKPTHPNIQHFASALGKEIKMLVCKEKYVPANPCGDRDVKVEADALRTVYLTVNGVVEKREILSIVDAVIAFRGEKYKAIPIEITFYAGFKKHILGDGAHVRTNSEVVYKTTLKGE